MKNNYLINFVSFKIIIFIKCIIYILSIKSKKDLLNDIIIFENTNGDIYLAQNELYTKLIFGTTLSNREERIFYGLNNDKDEKYIFENNNLKIPYIKKKIERKENKEISKANIGIIGSSKNNKIILIGTDNSYIELFNIDDYTQDLKIFSPTDFFLKDSINKGISPTILSYSNYLFYASSTMMVDNPSKYYISLHNFYFYQNDFTLNYNNTFTEIKGEYLSCFFYRGKIIYISCFYLDINDNYQITFIENTKNKDNIDIFEEKSTTFVESLSHPFDGEFYFLKGISLSENDAIYAYYSGKSNEIPTFLIKTINTTNYSITEKYDEYPAVYLNDYTFNNDINNNDLVLNDFTAYYFDFYFISTNDKKEYLIIAYLIFYTSSSKNNLVKRYHILKIKDYYDFKIFHGIKAIIFNYNSHKYLTLAFDFCLSNFCQNLNNESNGNAALIIFSFPNRTKDIYEDFIECAFENNGKYIVANLTKNFVINNNIFGYQFGNITINEITDDYFQNDVQEDGITIYFEKTGKILEIFNFLAEQALIRIDFSNYSFDEIIYDSINIRYSIGLKPPNNLDEFNSYWDYYNDTFGDINDQDSYRFKSKRTIISSYNINLTDNMSTKCNDKNCTLCLENDKNYCIVCKDEYTIINDKQYKYGKIKICKKTIIDDLLDNKYYNVSLSNEDIKNFLEEIKTYLKNIYDGNNVKINTKNVKIQISNIDEQKNTKELSNVYLGECEKQLKLKYCKSDNDSLILLKFDIKPENEKSTFVVYEVFEPYLKSQIDLNQCLQNKILIDIPIKFDTKIESIYESLSNSGYNLFDKNNSFYNDICTTYTTQNGTDILLYDRRMDIYQSTINISLCQEGCKFIHYDSKMKKAKCECPKQIHEIINVNLSNINFDQNYIIEKFKEVLKNSNFRVLKCYNLVFNSKLFIKNIGSIFMTLIIFLFLILIVIYIFISYKKIHFFTKEIIANNFGNNQENEINKGNNNEKNLQEKSPRKKKRVKKKKKLRRKISSNYPKNNKNNINFPPKKGKQIKEKNRKISIKNKQSFAINYDNNNNIYESSFDIKSSNWKLSFRNDCNKTNGYSLDIYNKKYNNAKEQFNFDKESIPNNKQLKNDRIKKANNKSLDIINKKKLNTEEILINLNDYEINSLEYKKAIKIYKRTYFQYYISLLKKKQLILFTFLPTNDYNLISLKASLFLVSFSLYLTINAFFFNDETMHKIYRDNGAYNIISRIPKIFYSSVTSSIINLLLKTLSLSEKNILTIKNQKNEKDALERAKKVEKCIKIKFLNFFIVSFLLILFFWYFISCFCTVYSNTQIILIKDTLISFILSMLYPFGLCLIPGIFRIPSLRAKLKDKISFYILSQYLALLL